MEYPRILESDLIAGLQPIRWFVLAQGIYHFMDSGIREMILDSGELSITDLANKLGLQEKRLRGFLQYLANEGYVTFLENGNLKLTNKGKEIGDYYPWYKLLVGGYAQTFQQISAAIKEVGMYADRDSTSVGIGSCGISQHDALPMTRRLLQSITGKWQTVVDLGCGDGSYLVDLCKSIPDIHGIGLDPDPNSVKAALIATTKYGISDRVYVQVGSASLLPDLSNEQGPLCFITAFVLQEILEQSGRTAIIEMMQSVFNRYPDSYWVVIEVDHRPNDPSVMETGLGLAYYNPYYLIHNITEQRLERVAFWEELFHEVGLSVLSIERPDPFYDSLGLKVGFLLSRSEFETFK